MGLDQIYTDSIANRGPIRQNIGSSMPVTRERDPNLIQLENNVFNQLAQIARENSPKTEIPIVSKITAIRQVSVEDAIRELLDLEKNAP